MISYLFIEQYVSVSGKRVTQKIHVLMSNEIRGKNGAFLVMQCWAGTGNTVRFIA